MILQKYGQNFVKISAESSPSPLNLIFGSNLRILINLMVEYDQFIPKLHVYIKTLMKRHHSLTLNGIPATRIETIDKMPNPNKTPISK